MIKLMDIYRRWGDDAYICDYCVEKANLVINENNLKKDHTEFELKILNKLKRI